MQWLALIPLIVKLIELAEAFFGGKEGAKKKELVTETLKAVISTTKEVSTGGQKETWEKLEPELSTAIDQTVAILYPPEITQQPSG